MVIHFKYDNTYEVWIYFSKYITNRKLMKGGLFFFDEDAIWL